MKKVHSYRPDIDGLRALAVLPVILYHADLGCSGGFVGVDVFFVISGFLITSLILEEINDGSFSAAQFWERRIRRIFPALSVVVLASLIAGWFLFWPGDFEGLGQSVMAQSALSSNFFFWRKLNYFNPGLSNTPLLHTWSLAVEEQFYLLFPLLLIFLARHKKLSLAGVILVLGLVSFALGVAGTYLAPTTTYYMLPTRAWELMTGTLLAAIPGRAWSGPRLNEIAGLAGLALILGPAFCYTRETRFPGLAALPPCAGAALIIFSGQARATLTSRLLTWKPLVFVGLISYSLYLWHWPLLVFVNYSREAAPGWPLRAGELVLSFALAILSWRYIETPFRKRLIWPRRPQLFAFGIVSQLTLLIAGAAVYFDHGMISRMPAEALAYFNYRHDYAFRNEISLPMAAAGQFAELGGQSTNKPVEILLWGDSHAMAVAPALDELCRRHAVRGVEATHSCTAPVLGYANQGMYAFAGKSIILSQSIVDFIVRQHVPTVVIAAEWSGYAPAEEVRRKLVDTVRTVMASGARVYVLRDVPSPGYDVPRFMAMAVFHHEDLEKLEISPAKYAADNRDYEPMFAQLSQMGATVLDPAKCFLNSRGAYDLRRGKTLLYWDANHLTVEGAEQLEPMFEPLFRHP